MNLFSWLFQPARFRRFEDSFAIEREKLWPRLRDAIVKQQSAGQSVWVVCHFPAVFFEAQNRLAEWRIEYQIVDQPVSPQAAESLSAANPASIQLTLAELLTSADAIPKNVDESVSISMIAIERHPMIIQDRQLELFARTLACPVQFGYYLALDDLVVSRVVNETMLVILKQLGMKDHELITSNMITRRLDKVLAREASGYDPNLRADSAEEWMAEAKKSR